MKLHVLIPAAATALVMFALSGCIKEKEMASEVPQMTITVSIPDDDATKAAFSVPGSEIGLHLAWQAGDQIRVISGSNSAVYNIQPGFTDHEATFSGPVVAGDVFDIVCPGTFATVAAAQVGNPNLTQNGNGSTEHLVFTAKLGGVAKADLSNIGFTDAWVAAHPGTTLKKGGIVKLTLTLPDELTAPQKVVLSGVGEDIAVNITGVNLTSEHVLTAYAQSGWDDIAMPNGSSFTVSVTNSDESVFASTKTISANTSLKAGAQNIIKVAGGFAEQDFAGGNGSEASPYLIANAKHMDNMHKEGVLKHQERVFFRLIADVDMGPYIDGTKDQSWEPLNWKKPYDYIIDFDGGNHVISNFKSVRNGQTEGDWSHEQYDKPSFFGLLYGSCYNVIFDKATIETNKGTSGVLGGYVGYEGKKAVVYNVHLKNSAVTRTNNQGDSGVGGFASRIIYAYFDSCSADNINISANNCDFLGGIFGIALKDASRIRNCWSSGTIYGNQKLGGIGGAFINSESELINCYSIATINAMRFGAGIIGECCMDAGSSSHYAQASTLMPDNLVQGCIAWQTELRTRDQAGEKDGWASGAIIGLTATHNYLSGCKRNAAMVFDDFSDALILYDQEDASPGSELVVNNPKPSVYKHYYPYHGKSFSGTLSKAAKSLNWDEDVWNLSGDIPVLTGAVEATPAVALPVSGNSDIPNVATTSRAFPSNGDTKNGLTWEVSEVRPGIRYYHAHGIPTDEWWKNNYGDDADGQYQEFFVVDLDLSKTEYDVKVVVTSSSTITSNVFESMGAIAAINGGYEKASIAVKGNSYLDVSDGSRTDYVSGYPYSYMPNNTIGDTGVANWKSEGAFYSDGHQGVRIAFDAYGGGATGKTSTGSTITKGPKAMRRYYKESTDEYAGFISSAPVLDANYVRFGMTFYSRAATGNNAESPKVHQGGCYSRTAVGIAYPNGDDKEAHLLLFVNDGKYAKSTQRGYGMSAYHVERVMANFFGPKYLLNLDGGGSTTMCVEGKGEGVTHVVNYPSDNYTGKYEDPNNPGKYIKNVVDHGGERARDSFIVIVPAE